MFGMKKESKSESIKVEGYEFDFKAKGHFIESFSNNLAGYIRNHITPEIEICDEMLNITFISVINK